MNCSGKLRMRFDGSIDKTVNLLSAARVAIYPVDVRGATVPSFYTAENALDPTITSAPQLLGPPPGVTADAPSVGTGGLAGGLQDESQAKNSSNSTMDMLAGETGGKAFYDQNDLSGIIGKVTDHSADFYTISYSPSDAKMDGTYRKIDVKVGDGEHYTLSYRRGYVARDEDLPGAAQSRQDQAAQHASQDPMRIDPLEPFMVFGMPQSEQILYKTRIQETNAKPDGSATAKPSLQGPLDHYSVDFALDLDDLNLKPDPDGLRKDTLNVSMIVYDKYGQITGREDHLVKLEIKPDVYPIFQKTGVQTARPDRCAQGTILASHWRLRADLAQGGHHGGSVQRGQGKRRQQVGSFRVATAGVPRGLAQTNAALVYYPSRCSTLSVEPSTLLRQRRIPRRKCN